MSTTFRELIEKYTSQQRAMKHAYQVYSKHGTTPYLRSSQKNAFTAQRLKKAKGDVYDKYYDTKDTGRVTAAVNNFKNKGTQAAFNKASAHINKSEDERPERTPNVKAWYKHHQLAKKYKDKTTPGIKNSARRFMSGPVNKLPS